MRDDARRLLLLWDVDGTLILTGGVSKANYALAFELLVGRPPKSPARTGGRTDIAIMHTLLADNGVDPASFSCSEQGGWLAEAGRRNQSSLRKAGSALPGAEAALRYFAQRTDVIQSALTGNIEPNAHVKLETFGLDRYIDFEVGAFGSESAMRSDLVSIARGKARRRGFDVARDLVVLVGDSVRDVEAGLGGGARVIGVSTGEASESELRDAGADVVLTNLMNLHLLSTAVDQLTPV